MTKEQIKQLIKSKKNDIDDQTLEYFSNYFYVLFNRPEIINGCNIEELISNALLYAQKIVFYNEHDEIYKELGPDCKGLREHESKTIYIRDNLEEPLREITIYHELHHAVQTNPQNNEVGINQETNFGRLIMEAQTQYFAEEVYQKIHGVEFEEQETPTEKMRMIPGGTIVSRMHNYEMYDSLISKICILLNITKDFLVHINFLYKDNSGMKLLKSKYDEAKEYYNFPHTFEDFMFRLDYIYCVDLLAYKENPNKEAILSGQEPEEYYEIYVGKNARVSLQKQFATIDEIDRKYFLCLLEKEENYIPFIKYICSNETKKIASQILEVPSSDGISNGPTK